MFRQAALLLALGACADAGGDPPHGATLGEETGGTTTHAGTTSEGGAAAGGAGAVGAGGAAPACGDGVLGAGEECDDANLADGDGCTAACTVECDLPGLATNEAVWKDPVSHHCYRWAGGMFCSGVLFAAARADCVAWGGELAALSTLEERDAVAAALLTSGMLDVLLGARDNKGDGNWTWLNGEPWGYADGPPAWQAGEPQGGTFLEMYYEGGFLADGDGTACGWVCERTPAGG